MNSWLSGHLQGYSVLQLIHKTSQETFSPARLVSNSCLKILEQVYREYILQNFGRELNLVFLSFKFSEYNFFACVDFVDLCNGWMLALNLLQRQFSNAQSPWAQFCCSCGSGIYCHKILAICWGKMLWPNPHFHSFQLWLAWSRKLIINT